MALHVADRDGEFAGDFFVGQFLIVTQFDDDAPARGKRGEGGADLVASFADFERGLGTLGGIGVPFFIQLADGFLRFEAVETKVGGDAPYPGTEFALHVEGIEPRVDAYEGILREVFGFAAFTRHAIADVEDARLVARDEFAKRLGFAATGTEDEVAVGGRIHVRSVIQFGGGKSCREEGKPLGHGLRGWTRMNADFFEENTWAESR